MKHFLLTGGNGFIGTNLVEALRGFTEAGDIVTIIDIQAPQIALLPHEQWIRQDILDKAAVFAIFENQRPDIVIHLAAETACLPDMVLADYLVNTKGSDIIFEACEKYGVGFCINTSTQFVHQADHQPVSDIDFAPHTVYGESKAIAEKMLREERFHFNWAIIRPTNVWGPYHLRYPYEFWKVLKQGRYFHPGGKPVKRSYGFVGNVCDQILSIIRRKDDPAIARQVFYVGDAPVNVYDWVNDFSKEITGRSARIIPGAFVYLLAVGGTVLQKLGIKFPINISRYKSMTTDNPAPMEKTFSILGQPAVAQRDGVRTTVQWLNGFWKEQA